MNHLAKWESLGAGGKENMVKLESELKREISVYSGIDRRGGDGMGR